MKWYFKVIAMVALAASIVSCKKDDMKYADAEVSAVENLYAPADAKAVKLLSSSSAALYFEWQSALVADGGAAQYEVVFDKSDGDFSKPLYTVTSDNNGNSNGANISHKILNQIATKAGVNPGESGDVIWSVYAIRGMKRVLSKAKKVLNIKTLEGFAEIPDELFIAGEATEGGTDVAASLPFKLVGNGEYEIFTKLEAGKKYIFTDRKSAEGRVFYSEDQTKIKEGETGSNSIAKTAVYRIRIDFNVAAVTYTETWAFISRHLEQWCWIFLIKVREFGLQRALSILNRKVGAATNAISSKWKPLRPERLKLYSWELRTGRTVLPIVHRLLLIISFAYCPIFRNGTINGNLRMQ